MAQSITHRFTTEQVFSYYKADSEDSSIKYSNGSLYIGLGRTIEFKEIELSIPENCELTEDLVKQIFVIWIKMKITDVDYSHAQKRFNECLLAAFKGSKGLSSEWFCQVSDKYSFAQHDWGDLQKKGYKITIIR